MYIHKNGIMLRKLERTDLNKLLELKNESWTGTHNVTIINIDDQIKWFDSMDHHTKMFLIAVHVPTNTEVGLYKIQNLDWINRKYDSGHDVFLKHRGNGYGNLVLEAGVDFGFEILNMNRIDTEILENNLASIATAKYSDFVHEGTKRNAIYKCGSYINSLFFGLLRDDWIKSERVLRYHGVCNTNYTGYTK